MAGVRAAHEAKIAPVAKKTIVVATRARIVTVYP
jgi:hypothetical protein